MLETNGTRHTGTRQVLRIVGPIVLITGIVLTVVGVASLFSAMGSFKGPKLFWCCFVGVPMIGVGGMICQFAYFGSMARYVANEVAPVGKDVVNYMADGTKGAVRTIAGAIGDGLRGRTTAEEPNGTKCPGCGEANDDTAKFCKACGGAIPRLKACTECGEQNDVDARFCDNCGHSLA